ncbi:MAG: Fic family protein [Chloroflexi bacterium]|nr:Fic family protein [Chloroflexota bacterium]
MKSDLARLTAKKIELDKHRPLAPAIVAKLREYFVVAWTYHSNAIEGSTITLAETRAILLDGITVNGKPLREHLEVINHSHAIDFVEALAQKDEPLTEMAIRQIHALVLRTIDDENAGSYRRGNVYITGSNFVPPDAVAVPSLMYDFGHWLASDEANRLHPVEFAALAHFRLVDIHPFVDGNGRSGRLLMNLMLMRAGYPPAIVRAEDRVAYYDALEKAHAGDTRDFVGLMAQAVERSLDVYVDAAPRNGAA